MRALQPDRALVGDSLDEDACRRALQPERALIDGPGQVAGPSLAENSFSLSRPLVPSLPLSLSLFPERDNGHATCGLRATSPGCHHHNALQRRPRRATAAAVGQDVGVASG